MDSPDRHQVTETWLVSLAQDVIDHEGCDGCKHNAAQALAAIGRLDEVLARLGKADPRSRPENATVYTNSAAYQSNLTITFSDGTVLRDDEAHEHVRRHLYERRTEADD